MRNLIVSFDIQNTENGEHLGTAEVIVEGGFEQLTPLIEDIIRRNWHDDFELKIAIAS